MRTQPLLLLVFIACAQPAEVPVTPHVGQTGQALKGDAVADFREWLNAWQRAPRAAQPDLVREGERLAVARRPVMHARLTSDPESALAAAVTPLERLALPAAIAQHLEEWRDGVGAVHVIVGCSTDDTPVPTDRFVTFDDAPTTYLRAGVFGPRAERSRAHTRLHGVSLDGAFALSDSRLRALLPGEPTRDLTVEQPSSCTDGVSAALYDSGDARVRFCSPEQATQYESALAATEEIAPPVEEPPGSTWTEGTKKVLLIRVDFSDRVGDPVSTAGADSLLNSTVKNFYTSATYGKLTIVGTVTPTIRLPKTQAQYQMNQDYMTLMTDARVASKAAGFDPASYDLDVIGFVATFSGGWAGRAWVGSKGAWLNGYFDLRVTGHELGHNFGFSHANYWNANGLTIIGPGTNTEYGHVFDMMGSTGSTQSHHFSAWYKRNLDWMPSAEANVITSSGTFRIAALENIITSGFHGLKIRRDAQKDYWVEFRNAFTGNATLQNGVVLYWGYAYNTSSHLLDMTPGDGDRGNASLVIGRTFSDQLAGIHITPVGKAGTTPEAVDVVVNLGTFPGNRAPTVALSASSTTPATGQSVTLNATASDPDGDPLAYAWSFDDGTLGPNAATATKSWGTARAWSVRVVVSDMKGQTASASLLVTVGAPTTFTLQGQVLSGGQPLGGVRISDGARATFTSSDGRYALTNVPAGSFTLSAAMVDYSFTAGFTQPVAVSASMMGLDFTATAVAGYQVQGRVAAGTTGVAGVLVSDGSRTATTNSNGDYTLANVPTGRYTLTATKAGWRFSPAFTNPVEVFGGALTGQNFSPAGASLSGMIPAAGVTTAPVVTDGVRAVTATISGTNWYWSLNGVPNGSWNVIATSPGVTLTPDFANPIVTTGAYRSGLNFSRSATPGVMVSGTVTTGGTPLPGVVVSDGTRTSTTDELGHYVLVAVPAGAYTLTPSLATYTFVPATRSVTAASAAISGQDFATTVVNLPPTVVNAPTANPNPVTTGTTTQLSVLGNDDSGEAALTYTWTPPSSGWPLSFSANGTNAAKSTTVTFTGTGTYTLECVIADPGGLLARAQVVVQVQQTVTGIAVSPTTANLLAGTSRTFSANLVDQFGRNMYQGSPTWALSGGGTFTSSGWSATFTAGATPGGPFTLTATQGTRSASATITVTSAANPVISTAASATPSPVTGKTTTVSVRATDDNGEPALTYTWASVGGPAPVTFSVNGNNTAKDSVVSFAHAGDYQLQVTVADAQGNVAVSSVSVTVRATPTTLDVQPAIASLQVGQTLQLSATVNDQFDDALSPPPTLSWAMPTGGTVSASGLVTAGSAAGGPWAVNATAVGLHGSSQVTVGEAPDTQPPSVALVTPIAGARVAGMTSLEATATDAVGVTRVDFFVDAVKVGEAATSPWTVQVDFSSVADGSHTLTAKAFDAAGNAATSDGVVVTVGNGPVDSAPPVVHLVKPANGATTGLTLVAEADATDDVGVTRVELELDGAVVKALASAPWVGSLTVSEGAHTLVAVAWDASGKFTRSEAVTFTATGQAPNEDVPPSRVEPERVIGGCGCSGVDGGVLPLLALGLFALARRRRIGLVYG